MTTDQTNYLNIGLMVLSLIMAFMLPFEVFLFSYAVLGPLHYLTEISWLHDRNYFSPKKFDWVPIAFLGLLILLGARSVMGDELTGFLDGIGLQKFTEFLSTYSYDITFLAFGLALVFVATKDWAYRIAGIMILLLVAYIFHFPEPGRDEYITVNANGEYALADKLVHPFYKAFAVYLPTLIHVYLFTGAFIIFGALKRNSRSGYISFAVFIACALACFMIPWFEVFGISDWAKRAYGETFTMLSEYLAMDLGGMSVSEYIQVRYGSPDGKNFVFTNEFLLAATRFIGFAYTYHYLNWFSKTNIIQWHKVPKARFAVVIVAWIASVALYFYDYAIGFRWLFLLSFLHVLLEFPLNHQSFIGIGRELSARFSGNKGGSAPVKNG